MVKSVNGDLIYSFWVSLACCSHQKLQAAILSHKPGSVALALAVPGDVGMVNEGVRYLCGASDPSDPSERRQRVPGILM